MFVAAVRMLSARSAYVAPDAIGQQYGQVRAEKSASGESVDALDTRLAREDAPGAAADATTGNVTRVVMANMLWGECEGGREGASCTER